MSDPHAYARIDDRSYPQNAAGILARLVDTMGYRLYWALAQLPADLRARDPGENHLTIDGLLGHIRGMLGECSQALVGSSAPDLPEDDIAAIYALADHLARGLSQVENRQLFAVTLDGRPLWSLINGQLSDILTHIGQINSLRRMFGHPVPPHDLPGGTGGRRR
jgi:hypothetical protein